METKVDTETKQFQDFNITGLWHRNIYTSLEKLQNLERVCRDGGLSIWEYLQVAPARIPEIQFQHLKMMITEFGILLRNAKVKLSKTFLMESSIKLKEMKNLIDYETREIFYPIINQQNHQTIYILTERYYEMLKDINIMSSKIIEELSDELFGKQEDKISSMEKTQKVFRQ